MPPVARIEPRTIGGDTVKGLLLVSDASLASSVAGLEGLRPLLGRPFVLHVLEQIVLTGITEIDVILDTPRPLDYERALGTGDRHGTVLRYHLVRDPDRPGPHLRRFKDARLLALAHRVVNASQLVERVKVPSRPIVWCASVGDASGWSGWASLPAGTFSDLPEDVDQKGLAAWLVERGEQHGLLAAVRPLLAADDAARLLRAQDTAFHSDFLQKRGTSLPGDIRLGRNVNIDPAARLIGPVFIGDHVRVGAGAVVGPHAFVGAGAVIGRDTVLRHAVVTRRTCVGERLDIENAIASGNGLVHAGHAAEVRINDPYILSPMSRSPIDLRSWAQQGLALGLLTASAPLAIVALPWAAATGRLARQRQPRPSFTDFLTRVIPALPGVLRGRLALIGREETNTAETDVMPVGWDERLAALRPGLISAALVDADSSPIGRHLSDLAFGAAPSIRADIRLLARYFYAMVAGVGRGRRVRPAPSNEAWAMPPAVRIRN